ncbi:type II toxin-antitoxin system RelB/DinJ family antitoxin [Shewanella xiamenensis]|nr:type II toxin-antitoxin system RelB/DinJ family antitoxin [Shewanella xiamenensis]MEE1982848.1 type II toxin-antitoxin system RelB/DinJ family antitoxin [Shewanella xiamenensis]
MGTINIRIDDELKERSFAALEKLGVSPSEALRQTLLFEVAAAPLCTGLNVRKRSSVYECFWFDFVTLSTRLWGRNASENSMLPTWPATAATAKLLPKMW